MTAPLSSKQLFEKLLDAVDQSGWNALILSNRKPFKLRLYRNDESSFDAQFYIWNCTHGGGSARAVDEYRVQLTGVVPNLAATGVTLLLGWHSGYEVFVGFDIHKHSGQNSHSPSIQVKEETLQSAHTKAFATYRRHNGEIAVAFRPEFLVDYALIANSLHANSTAKDLSLLNDLNALTAPQIDAVANTARQTIISTIARKYRASDFRKRVLGAYEHRCAACGIQLELIDAAHIIPVVASKSTDETRNGIALCKLHHQAYDRNLISFDRNYKIEVSEIEIARLSEENLAGGLKLFKQQLRTAILLPTDRRDYPPPEYVQESRKIRNWR